MCLRGFERFFIDGLKILCGVGGRVFSDRHNAAESCGLSGSSSVIQGDTFWILGYRHMGFTATGSK